MIRIVFDTNIYVSSLRRRNGLPAQAIDAWRAHRLQLVTSPAILSEFTATLQYARIRQTYGVTDDEVSELIDLLVANAVVVDGTLDVSGSVPDDPDDEIVLACIESSGNEGMTPPQRRHSSYRLPPGVSGIVCNQETTTV